MKNIYLILISIFLSQGGAFSASGSDIALDTEVRASQCSCEEIYNGNPWMSCASRKSRASCESSSDDINQDYKYWCTWAC